jgi:hypothetical protein
MIKGIADFATFPGITASRAGHTALPHPQLFRKPVEFVTVTKHAKPLGSTDMALYSAPALRLVLTVRVLK